MKENRLVFNPEYTEAWLIFSNGKESFAWTNKKEAIKAINDCLKRQKITSEQASDFIDQIRLSNLEDEIEEAISHSSLTFILVEGVKTDSMQDQTEKKAPIDPKLN